MSSCMNFPAGTTRAGQARRVPARRSSATATRRSQMAQGHTNKGTRLRLPRARGLSRRPPDLRHRRRADRARHEGRVRRPRHAERLHRRQAARHAAAVHACATARPRRRVHDRREGHRLRRRPRRRHRRPDRRQVADRAARRRSTGVQHLGTVVPPGPQLAPSSRPTPAFDSTEDIDFDHEAELTTSRRFLLATDERGGGVTPPGASCPTSPADNPIGNGGIHAYRADRADGRRTPATRRGGVRRLRPQLRRAARRSTARRSARSRRRSLCTAHVFQQIPGQNRIFMGWYSQGTQVVDFTENPDGTIDFKEAGYFIPANANTWVSHVFKAQRNAGRHVHLLGRDRRLQPRRARAATRSTSTRSRCPAPPDPQGGTGTPGRARRAVAAPGRAASAARPSPGFRRVGAQRAKRGGLRLNFTRRARARCASTSSARRKGRSITRLKRVKAFRSRKRSLHLEGARACATATTSCASGPSSPTAAPTCGGSRCGARGGRFTRPARVPARRPLHEPRRRLPAQPAGVRRQAEARAVRVLPPQPGGRREAHGHAATGKVVRTTQRQRYAAGKGAHAARHAEGPRAGRLHGDDQRRAPGPHARPRS